MEARCPLVEASMTSTFSLVAYSAQAVDSEDFLMKDKRPALA
jgi:hypothetical protein